MFSQHDAQTLTHSDIHHLLSFVFTEMGITRPVDQNDLDSFLQEFQLQNQISIDKNHFANQQFLNFNKKNNQNLTNAEFV